MGAKRFLMSLGKQEKNTKRQNTWVQVITSVWHSVGYSLGMLFRASALKPQKCPIFLCEAFHSLVTQSLTGVFPMHLLGRIDFTRHLWLSGNSCGYFCYA